MKKAWYVVILISFIALSIISPLISKAGSQFLFPYPNTNLIALGNISLYLLLSTISVIIIGFLANLLFVSNKSMGFLKMIIEFAASYFFSMLMCRSLLLYIPIELINGKLLFLFGKSFRFDLKYYLSARLYSAPMNIIYTIFVPLVAGLLFGSIFGLFMWIIHEKINLSGKQQVKPVVFSVTSGIVSVLTSSFTYLAYPDSYFPELIVDIVYSSVYVGVLIFVDKFFSRNEMN